MIAYFDTSAIVPLLIAEPATEPAGEIWESADRIVSARLAYPETCAALAHAARLHRISARGLRNALREFEAMFEEIDVVEVDDAVARRAGALAGAHQLRAYDAVHLAAADRVQDDDFVLVAGDVALLDAARERGMAIAALA